MKKILIITSCTGEKAIKSDRQLTLDDFKQGIKHIRRRELEFADALMPAEKLYTGLQHARLMRGITKIRTDGRFEVDLQILSAGYGLIDGARPIAPYECTFSGMKKKELEVWSAHLDIAARISMQLSKDYDICLMLLGDDYLRACDLTNELKLGGPTIVFTGKASAQRLPKIECLQSVVLGNADTKKFSCGLVGLKGEIAARLLEQMSADPAIIEELKIDPVSLVRSLGNAPQEKRSKTQAVANPKVDKVIKIPSEWWDKPHKAKLKYFIPEWDDLVDGDYDFQTDSHSGGGGDWSNEVYAHQMYREPNYDGILISKVVAEKSKKKKDRINELGVHRYLRVPRDFPVMGDCGAFGYISEQVPPYTTKEILDYYTRLDFDYGVSLDHLIVTATESEKQARYELTINNAEEFLKEHQAQGLDWVPIGAVQGWDPASYTAAAKKYVAMGYQYIALGGLVRTSTPKIMEILESVHKVVPETIPIHLFGLARINVIGDFARLGVRSVDSASYLRRAWMGTGQNYLTDTGDLFAAIRIPEAEKSFRAKRIVSEGRATLEQVKRLEQRCLKVMRQIDSGNVSVDRALDILEEYDRLITPDRPDNRSVLKRVLEAQPWKQCKCAICERDGIEVIIFRGNNRNRRRGFHNTYVFYRLIQRVLSGQQIDINRGNKNENPGQIGLFGQTARERE